MNVSQDRWFALILCGLSAVAVAVVLRQAGSRADAAWIVPLCWIWGVAAHRAVRHNTDPGTAWLMLVAAGMRFPMIGTPPLLSDDLYRYLWEGGALRAGYNPFISAPDQLAGLNDPLQALVNHSDIASIYPPLALWWFQLLSAVTSSPAGVQLATTFIDLGIVAALAWVLQGRRMARWPALLYALHPLPVIESCASAHLESVAILATVLAVGLWDRDRHGPAWIALAVGAGLKLLPAAMAWPYLRPLRRHKRVAFVVAAALLLTLSAAQVLAAGPALISALNTYGRHWSFNPLAYALLHSVLADATRPALLLLGAGAALLANTRRDPVRAWLILGSAFLVLSPTVHPWYVLWMLIPSLLVGSRTGSAASIALLGGYLVLTQWDTSTQSWVEPPWLPWISWAPALTLAGVFTVWEQLRGTAPSDGQVAPSE